MKTLTGCWGCTEKWHPSCCQGAMGCLPRKLFGKDKPNFLNVSPTHRHASAPGLVYGLFPLPVTFFSRIAPWPAPSPPSLLGHFCSLLCSETFPSRHPAPPPTALPPTFPQVIVPCGIYHHLPNCIFYSFTYFLLLPPEGMVCGSQKGRVLHLVCSLLFTQNRVWHITGAH